MDGGPHPVPLRGWPGDQEELEGGVVTGGGVLVKPDISLGSAGEGEVGFDAAADLRGRKNRFCVSGRIEVLWQNSLAKWRAECRKGGAKVDCCLMNQRLKEVSASGPFCHSAILPFCHLASLPFCHFAILPFCQFASLPVCYFAILPVCRFVSQAMASSPTY